MTDSASGADLTNQLYFEYSKKRGIHFVTVHEVPHSFDKKSYPEHRGRYGVRKIMVMGSEEYGSYVSLVNDDKWVFDRDGMAFADFEDTAAYKSFKTTDRFTHDMLVTYCRHLGLDPFSEDFYVPNGPGILLDFRHHHPDTKTSTLAEARASNEDRDVPPTGRQDERTLQATTVLGIDVTTSDEIQEVLDTRGLPSPLRAVQTAPASGVPPTVSRF
ncbi:hypothetical protein [Arthrobacter sp. YN]|uniref:hypothetical protein n=1 Tax=Arthrobacter sp. YN TaxID=2020486 RepID=UPI000B5E2D0B|nr:hypothetical protein [Arthrobacter sp. YN]ASN22186.1 hypothetical protein CGK93_22870 [Arthrobacter sp. YN]